MFKAQTLWMHVGMALVTTAVGLGAQAATVDVAAEATVRSGVHADTDQNEASAGYVFTKFENATGDFSRKAYYQFDLSGQDADLSKAATFSLTLRAANDHAIKVWALDQAYAGFNAGVTWNTAQANDTATNDMLTAGAFTATQIGDVIAVPGVVGGVVDVELSSLAPFVFDDKITFAVTGASDAGIAGFSNDSGGLRVWRGTSNDPAQLTFDVVPEPSSLALIGIGGLALLRRRRQG